MTDISALSFEDALTELEKIVRQLEEGKSKLDDAISSYERGAALQRHCQKKLEEARMKVEQITLTPQGEVKSSPFQVEGVQ